MFQVPLIHMHVPQLLHWLKRPHLLKEILYPVTYGAEKERADVSAGAGTRLRNKLGPEVSYDSLGYRFRPVEGITPYAVKSVL